MTRAAPRPGDVAAAAVFLGGLLTVAFPQHLVSIVQVTLVSVAVAAGARAAMLVVPEWNAPARWSPFSRRSRPLPAPSGRADQLDWIRMKLSGRRQRIDGAPSLPPETLKLLQSLIGDALEREGWDRADEASATSARALLAPRTRAVLAAEPLDWPSWHRTLRPSDGRVAAAVHDVLDDLDRLTGRPSPVRRSATPPRSP